MRKSFMIIDGQWGSTGKGLIAGHLAREFDPDTVVCNFGPNAGHTFVEEDGEKVVTCQLPTAIVAGPKNVLIGPGAIVDPDKLMEEMDKYSEYLKGKSVIIHPRAARVTMEHKMREAAALGRISSTMKGTGAAIAAKVMRETDAIMGSLEDYHPVKKLVVSENLYDQVLTQARVLQIESAQGFELGVNQGTAYPYCTSRDITPTQILADCGIPFRSPYSDPYIVTTLRTFPIRVGHQYDLDGNKVGDSGPVYEDQVELAWESLGFTPERTTVTNKIRRIFSFSYLGLQRMLHHVRPDSLFMNFMNYLDSALTQDNFIHRVNNVATPFGAYVEFTGYGSKASDVKHVGNQMYRYMSRGAR